MFIARFKMASYHITYITLAASERKYGYKTVQIQKYKYKITYKYKMSTPANAAHHQASTRPLDLLSLIRIPRPVRFPKRQAAKSRFHFTAVRVVVVRKLLLAVTCSY